MHAVYGGVALKVPFWVAGNKLSGKARTNPHYHNTKECCKSESIYSCGQMLEHSHTSSAITYEHRQCAHNHAMYVILQDVHARGPVNAQR
jgi:hypothetical protein